MFGLFGTRRVSHGTIEEVVDMMVTYFKKHGLELEGHIVDTCEGYGWWIQKGSAKIYIFIQEGEDHRPLLRVNSAILHVPGINRELFYSRLLELNRDMTSCWLSTYEEVVIVTSQRPTLGLDQEELDEIVSKVAKVADTLDDQLAKEFNAQLFTP